MTAARQHIRTDKSPFNGLIAFGANLPGMTGGPAETVALALDMLEGQQIKVIARSRDFRSPAFPPGSGPDFVNGAAAVAWDGDAASLLERLHGIEARLGRVRQDRWAPRAIDLDLIAFADEVRPDPETQDHWRALPLEQQARTAPPTLILPHPRMQERAFVLRPLADIAPDWRHPRTGLSVSEMLQALDPAQVAAVEPVI